MKDIDLFGHKVKPLTAGAIVVGSGAVIWFAVKQHQAAAGSSSSSAIDPLTGLPSSQDNVDDPLTGLTYAGEAQQYGSVSAAEQAAAGQSSLDLSSAYGTGGGGVIGSSGATTLVPSTDTTAATYATNAAWAQAVEAGLTDVGYTSTDVSAALGRYLGSLSETADQATIVDAAIAEYGPPPVGTYTVILAPATTATGSGNTGTGTSTGTTTTGTGTATGSAPSSPAATVSKVSAGKAAATATGAVVSWTASGPAKSWKVTIAGPGPIDGKSDTVTKASATYSGLESGHTYEVTVQPLPSGTAGKITFATSK